MDKNVVGKDKKVVFKSDWFNVEQEYFNHIASLNNQPYYRINSSDSVMILSITRKKEIILVKQFRPALNEYTLEIPCGLVDRNEKPKDAAVRELFEETGHVSKNWDFLNTGRIMMSRHNSFELMYYAPEAELSSTFIKNEGIEVVLVEKEKFKEIVKSGEFKQLAAMALFVLADWKFKLGMLI